MNFTWRQTASQRHLATSSLSIDALYVFRGVSNKDQYAFIMKIGEGSN